MTTLSAKTQYGEYSVSDNREYLDIDGVMELVRCLLLAMGYAPEVVGEWFDEGHIADD